jgi:2,4-dienoyl-CoA reductase-like NADH-dependent reductase (Old Yellow Enzyme family)/thioredoxin reductase
MDMSKKYAHLLSPLKVGNTIFRNRLLASATGLHALQGGEPYPTEAIMDTHANRAKGGAAMVTLMGTYPNSPIVSDGKNLCYDLFTPHNRHYLAQLAEAVHFYGAKASWEIMFVSNRPGYDVSAGIGRNGKPSLEISEAMMDEIADQYAYHASLLQDLKYDLVTLHWAYLAHVESRFISPATNKRTDQYGGRIENRARFPMMIVDRIKQKCGQDFLIEVRISGTDQDPNGVQIEDSIALAKLLEGHIDLLQVHLGVKDAMAGNFQNTPNLAAAEAIKKSGTTLRVVTIVGYQDLDEAERIIAEGKADFIGIARGWIADPNLGTKAYEGRGEDVRPCIKCLRCHDSACIENRTYVCSVNPTIGLEHKLDKMVKPAAAIKKVAVVGGGPAGMQAALTASGRGHEVTLYEKSGVLGGQLNFSDYVSFKDSLNKFKKYLICQIEKSNIKVRLNTAVNVSFLESKNFDVVIGALGAEPVLPLLPGIEGKNVIMAPEVFGKETTLASKMVIIGGGQVGCETAWHLTLSGHEVTLIEMQDKIAPDASWFYRTVLIRQIKGNKKIQVILNARGTGIHGGVTYTDAGGATHLLEAGTVVIAAGMKPRLDEAMALWNTGDRFVMVGDCAFVGNVEKAIRTGFAAAIVL